MAAPVPTSSPAPPSGSMVQTHTSFFLVNDESPLATQDFARLAGARNLCVIGSRLLPKEFVEAAQTLLGPGQNVRAAMSAGFLSVEAMEKLSIPSEEVWSLVVPNLPPATLRKLCLTVEDSLLRHAIRCTNVACHVGGCSNAKGLMSVSAPARAHAQRLIDDRNAQQASAAAATTAAAAAAVPGPTAPFKRAYFPGSEHMPQHDLASWLFYAMHAKQCMANGVRNPVAGCPVASASVDKCTEKKSLWAHASLCPEYCKEAGRPPPSTVSHAAPACIDAQCVRLRKWWPGLKLAVAEGAIFFMDAGRGVMMRAYRLRHGSVDVPPSVPPVDRDAFALLEPYPEMCTSLLRAPPPLRARVLEVLAAEGRGAQAFLDTLRAEKQGAHSAVPPSTDANGGDAARLPAYSRLPGFMVQTPPVLASRSVPLEVVDAVRAAVRQQLDDASAATATAATRRSQFAPSYAHINVLAAAGVDTAALHPALQFMAPADLLRNAKPPIGTAPSKAALEGVLNELRRGQEAHTASALALESMAAGVSAPSVVGDHQLREVKLYNIIARMVAASMPQGMHVTSDLELPELLGPEAQLMDPERQALASRFTESMEAYKAFFAKIPPSWRRASVFSASGMGLAYRMRLAVQDARAALPGTEDGTGPGADAALARESMQQAEQWLSAVGARITQASDVFNEADPAFQTVAHDEVATLRHVTPLDRRDIARSLLPHFASDGSQFTASPVAVVRDATTTLGCSILAGVAAFARVRQQRLLRSLLSLRAEAEHGVFTPAKRAAPPPHPGAAADNSVPLPPMPVALCEYGSDTIVHVLWPATCNKWHAWYMKTHERVRNRAMDIARRRAQRQPEDMAWYNMNLESRDPAIAAPDKLLPVAQPLGLRDATDQHRTHVEQLCHKACAAYYMPAAHAMESQLRAADGMPALVRPQTDAIDAIAMAATERLFASSLADAVQVSEAGHVVINVAAVDDAITQCMKQRPTVTLQDVMDYFAAQERGDVDTPHWYADVAAPLPAELQTVLRNAAQLPSAVDAEDGHGDLMASAPVASAGTKRRREADVVEEVPAATASKLRAVGGAAPTRHAASAEEQHVDAAQQRAVSLASSIRALGHGVEVASLAAWAQARGRIMAVADADAGMAESDDVHVVIPDTALEATLSRTASAARLADAMAIV